MSFMQYHKALLITFIVHVESRGKYSLPYTRVIGGSFCGQLDSTYRNTGFGARCIIGSFRSMIALLLEAYLRSDELDDANILGHEAFFPHVVSVGVFR